MQINQIPSFKAIQLNNTEKEKAKLVFDAFKSDSTERQEQTLKNDLLQIFDKHLQQEALKKSYLCQDKENYLQNLYLHFFETIEHIKSKANSLDLLIESIDKHKVQEDDAKTKYKRIKIYSIDDLTPYSTTSYEKTYVNLKTADDLPVYTSAPSLEERRESKSKFKKLISSTNLTKSQSQALTLRSSGKTYKQISEKLHTSKTNTIYKVSTAIAKIQNENNILSIKIKNQAEAFKNNFKTNKTLKEIEQLLIKNPYLISYDIEKMADNVEKTAKNLGLSTKDYFNCVLSVPGLFAQKPETITNNVKLASKKLNLPVNTYLNACLKICTLFCLKPETIETNVNSMVGYFNFDRDKYIKSALRQPQLFYQKPSTLIENIEQVSEMIHVDPIQYGSACLKQPSLFVIKSRTILSNIEQSSNCLDIPKADFIKIGLIQPQLFLQKPQTILNNVTEYCKLLNMSKKEFMKIALKYPALLNQRADTNMEHIKESAKLLEVSEKELLEQAAISPFLFGYNPEKIKHKADIALLYKQIKGKQNENIIKAIRTITDEAHFDIILKYILQKQLGISLKNKNLHQNIQNFITTNENKKIKVQLPQNPVTKEFIDYVNNLSLTSAGKHIFDFKIKNV